MKQRLLISFIIFSFIISSFDFLAAATNNPPAGTLVKLSLEEDLSSRSSKQGEMVKFKVVNPVKVGIKTVISKGATAQAQISEIRGPGNFGRNARIKLNFLYVVDRKGNRVPIELGEQAAKINQQEGYAIGASAAGFLLLGPIGLVGGIFVHGKHVELDKGTKLFVEVSDK